MDRKLLMGSCLGLLIAACAQQASREPSLGRESFEIATTLAAGVPVITDTSLGAWTPVRNYPPTAEELEQIRRSFGLADGKTEAPLPGVTGGFDRIVSAIGGDTTTAASVGMGPSLPTEPSGSSGNLPSAPNAGDGKLPTHPSGGSGSLPSTPAGAAATFTPLPSFFNASTSSGGGGGSFADAICDVAISFVDYFARCHRDIAKDLIKTQRDLMVQQCQAIGAKASGSIPAGAIEALSCISDSFMSMSCDAQSVESEFQKNCGLAVAAAE